MHRSSSIALRPDTAAFSSELIAFSKKYAVAASGRRFQMRRHVILSALVALLATGCFDIEQSIDLKKDMSGTADLKMGIDFEPMVKFMAAMGKGMSGDQSPVTQADMDKAKADFKRQQSAKKTDPAEKKEDLTKNLPPGVKLLDSSVTEGDLSVTSRFKFAFDHLNRLAGLKMPSKE